MTIGNRIKRIRELSGKTQKDFAALIKIGQSTLAMFENGQRDPKDIHIEQICKKIKIDNKPINENWIRTGKGSPTIKLTRNQEIAEFANDIMELPDKNIKKKLILALSKLTSDDWERLIEIAQEVFEDENEKSGGE